jgi:hypothetical protein
MNQVPASGVASLLRRQTTERRKHRKAKARAESGGAGDADDR